MRYIRVKMLKLWKGSFLSTVKDPFFPPSESHQSVSWHAIPLLPSHASHSTKWDKHWLHIKLTHHPKYTFGYFLSAIFNYCCIDWIYFSEINFCAENTVNFGINYNWLSWWLTGYVWWLTRYVWWLTKYVWWLTRYVWWLTSYVWWLTR